MKSPARMILLTAIGLAGLLTGGWMGRTATPEPVLAATGPPRTAAQATNHPSMPGLTGNKRDFASLLRRFTQTCGVPAAGIAAIERSSNRELRDLIVSVAGEKIDRRDWEVNRKRYQALKVIAREIYHREGAACLVWAEATGSTQVFSTLLGELARLDPEAANKRRELYFSKHQVLIYFDDNPAACAAAMRGAAEMLAAEKFTGGGGSYLEGYAGDFDFRTYLAATSSRSGFDNALCYWSALDPVAAGKALRERTAAQPFDRSEVFATAFEGSAAVAGDAEAARWIGGILADVPAAWRDSAIQDLAQRRDLTSSRVMALTEHLPTDQDRVNFGVFLVGRGSRTRGPDYPLVGLEALKSEPLQVAALSTWLARPAGPMGQRNDQRELLERLMESLALPATKREALRDMIPGDDGPK